MEQIERRDIIEGLQIEDRGERILNQLSCLHQQEQDRVYQH
jgi:hypothetical protein